MKNILAVVLGVIFFFLLGGYGLNSLATPTVYADDVIDAGVPGTTPENPLLIYDKAGLKTAVEGDLAKNNSKIYLRFANDISYTNNDSFNIATSAEIDGAGFGFFYGGTPTQTYTGMKAAKTGLEITLKNIRFGDWAHPVQDYYGILLAQGAGAGIVINLHLENISYYATSGGQPLLMNNIKSKVTFHGKNSFTVISRSGTDSQEFMEGNNLIFAEDSETVIHHETTYQPGFINATGTPGLVSLTLQKRAKVQIITNKPNLIFGATQIQVDLGEESVLKVNELYNPLILSNNTAPTVFNVSKNASLELTGKGALNSYGTITVNSLDAAEVMFRNIDPNGAILTRNVTFKDSSQSVFPYMWQVGNDRSIRPDPLPLGKTVTLTNALVKPATEYNRVIYHRQLEIIDPQVTVETNPGISQIMVALPIFDPVPYGLMNWQLKLSKQRLWQVDTGDIASPEAQSAIEKADSSKVIASVNGPPTGQFFENLLAGTYYLYEKIMATSSVDTTEPRYTQSSLWQEFEVEVPKTALSISVPTELFFSSPQTGPFTDLKSPVEIKNLSNYPLSFTIVNVKEPGGNPIKLANELAGVPGTFSLQLNSTTGDQLGPLVLGDNHLTALNLEPFAPGKEVYLSGEWRGPNQGLKTLLFDFVYRLADVSEGGESK